MPKSHKVVYAVMEAVMENDIVHSLHSTEKKAEENLVVLSEYFENLYVAKWTLDA